MHDRAISFLFSNYYLSDMTLNGTLCHLEMSNQLQHTHVMLVRPNDMAKSFKKTEVTLTAKLEQSNIQFASVIL